MNCLYTGLMVFLLASMTALADIDNKAATQAAHGVISRIVPHYAGKIKIEITPSENGNGFFEISSSNSHLLIRGSDTPSVCAGFNWYLKYVCNAHVSLCGDQLELPAVLPKVSSPIQRESFAKNRYFLNYCSYGYTMAFWDWPQWQRQLDWMALNGINMALAIGGNEAVWQATMKRLGSGPEEIKKFIPGPAFVPWWLMGNLEGWGGPVSQDIIDHQANLQQKILARMRELGIKPVFQGFYGIVPNSFIKLFPNADIKPGQDWGGFTRPAFLMPTDPLFDRVAAVFYKEQTRLYGQAPFYCGDPFHEGGTIEGVNLMEVGEKIYKAMSAQHPQASWVLQAWNENPKEALLSGMPKDKTMILDLLCETNPQWKERNGFNGYPWIWCIVQNYGGKQGLYGKLQTLAELPSISNDPHSGAFSGMGALMEGFDNNPVVYDLLFEMPWKDASPPLEKWICDYANRRYGAQIPQAHQAWKILLSSVYHYPQEDTGAAESILCARPSLNVDRVSTWASSKLFHDPQSVVQAWKLLLECADTLSDSQTYRYDLTDVTRQALSDYSLGCYAKMIDRYKAGDKKGFEKSSQAFIQLLEDMDAILATNTHFTLGQWLDKAKNNPAFTKDSALLEFNARTLITVWGDRKAAVLLHDYAHRQWAGLMRDFYLPRWNLFIEYLRKSMQKDKPFDAAGYEKDVVEFEFDWTRWKNNYPSTGNGHTVNVSKTLWDKYGMKMIHKENRK